MADAPGELTTYVQTALVAAKRLARSLDEVRAVDYGVVHEDGKPTDRYSVRFHMNRKRRLADVPTGQRLPKTIEGIEVDVLDAGYAPHDGSPRAPQDRLQPGISVGSRKQKTTGTLGAIVRDQSTQRLGFISNWHVLCGGPEAEHGDEITQPGPMDSGSGRTVARLERWLRPSERCDAALALLEPDVAVTEALFGMDLTPVGTIAPALGMRVVKSGAVSGVTHARVDGIGGSYRLDYTGYGDAPEWMEGFRLVPDADAPAPSLSLEGDSGSLWVDSASGRAVGLHFAGEDDQGPLADYALAHPIEVVLARLHASLVGLAPP